MASLHSNRGAKRAREAREALGYTREGPLPDLLEAIEHRGGAHAVVLELPDGVAGAYIAKPDCPLLLVNGRQALARQRFTLAHEFGHYRMRHGTVVDEQSAVGRFGGEPDEICANAFAAEFLMPRDAVAAWGERSVDGAVTLEHIVLFAYEYGVSAPAARYAFETAGLLTSARRRKQLDDELAENLHVELAQRLGLEPLDDELADAVRRLPRIPPRLSGSALVDLFVGNLDVDALAVRLGRERVEVEAMLTELRFDQLLPTPASD